MREARASHGAGGSESSTVSNHVAARASGWNWESESKIYRLYDMYALIRAVRLKHLPAKWLTDQIKVLIFKKVVCKSKLSEKNIKPSEISAVIFLG